MIRLRFGRGVAHAVAAIGLKSLRAANLVAARLLCGVTSVRNAAQGDGGATVPELTVRLRDRHAAVTRLVATVSVASSCHIYRRAIDIED